MIRVTEGAAASIVVAGSINMDIVVPVPRHPAPGETILGGEYFRNPGGKGANQAVAASRLGQSVALLGSVGDDEPGRTLVATLRDEGVDTTWVSVDATAPTGIAIVTVDPKGENAIVVSPGANRSFDPRGVGGATAILGKAVVTLLQLEVPLESVSAAARSSGGIVVLNPAPARQLPPELVATVDVLVPNRLELATLVGADIPKGLEQVTELAAHIRGPRAVVVTLGAEGALLVEQGLPPRHVPAPEIEVVDTTGAGDAFCGALADALVRKEPLEKAVRWAVRAAALATTQPGAQTALPSRSDIEETIA